ncbi:hypothetical protein NMG60_11021459 [Bertholletia excelsa]
MKQIGGMSDLCMYEIEDIVWDEFDQTDDHIVPHPGIEPAFQGDSCKKPRREVIGSSACDSYTAKYASQGKGGLQHLKNPRATMLEKDAWCHTPEAVFPDSHDGELNEETANISLDNTKASNHCFKKSKKDSIGDEFCADDPMISGRCAAVDGSSYCYPLGDIAQSDNDLSFFRNDCEDKESNDLLYYGWPDIENFEDVDRMFRSCDSTFGLGNISNEDELSWFFPSHAIEGSEDVLKSDFKLNCPESSPFKERHEPMKLNAASPSVNDSNMETASISYNSSFGPPESGNPDTHGHLTFTNDSEVTETKDEFTPKEQGVELIDHVHVNMSAANQPKNDNTGMKKQAKHHNQSEKRKERSLENGRSFRHSNNVRYKDSKLLSGKSSYEVLTSPEVQNQGKNVGPGSFGCLQNHIPYMHLDYNYPSDQITNSTPLAVKSESDGLTSFSPKESSYASNQALSMESSHCHSFENPVRTVDDKRGKLQHPHAFHSSYTNSLKHVDLIVPSASCESKKADSQNEVENQTGIEGVSTRIPTDLDISNVQESSSMSSGVDEISLEESSFRQLQQVMEKLDIRTKLCIRDSLYRLARSAEQRHHYSDLNGGTMDDRDTSGALMAEGTNKCNGFMDMETNTNPIDRSIAHLLFHRPSDSSVMPAHDGLSLKSRAMIHGSITSSPVVTEQLDGQEETANEADKVADH